MNKLSLSVNVDQRAALLKGHVLQARHLFEVGPEDIGSELWPLLVERLSLHGDAPASVSGVTVTGPALDDLLDGLRALQALKAKEAADEAARVTKWLTEAQNAVAAVSEMLAKSDSELLIPAEVSVPLPMYAPKKRHACMRYQGYQLPEIPCTPYIYSLGNTTRPTAEKYKALVAQLQARLTAANEAAYQTAIPALEAELVKRAADRVSAEQDRLARIASKAAIRLETGLYERETESYNSRRYGSPWIAKVSYPNGPKAVYEFGQSSGQWGKAGVLSVECRPGDIIAYGQKDLRKHDHEHTILVMLADGRMQEVDKAGAYAHFKAAQQKVSA